MIFTPERRTFSLRYSARDRKQLLVIRPASVQMNIDKTLAVTMMSHIFNAVNYKCFLRCIINRTYVNKS